MTSSYHENSCREKEFGRLRSVTREVRAETWLLASTGWVTLMIVTLVPAESPLSAIRPTTVFLFVLICPGLAVARSLTALDFLEQLVVGVALSIAAGLLVGVAFTLARNDSTTLRLTVLASIATVPALVAVSLAALRSTSTARTSERP